MLQKVETLNIPIPYYYSVITLDQGVKKAISFRVDAVIKVEGLT